MQSFSVKDFVITGEGLAFAVVDSALEEDRVLCFLRYVRDASGWRKLDTAAANALLASCYPHYRYYSPLKDTHLHAVPVAAIVQHCRSPERLQSMLRQSATDPVEQDLAALCELLRREGLPLTLFGITGSLLIGAQHTASDLDIVVYDRDLFRQTRSVVRRLLDRNALQHLNEAAWQETYKRRCCALSLEEYVWHERRKFNKACINCRKFDLSFVAGSPAEPQPRYRKLGLIALQTRVKDACYAFDYPAVLLLEHPDIGACISYTATYVGQAENGEWIEVRGFLEEAEDGTRRIVVGSSREAQGEYIKVIKNAV